MSLNIVKAALTAENTPDLHIARLLFILLHSKEYTVDGLTKLAKLDFLVRYPTYFERLLSKTRKRPPPVPMADCERDSVESKMIRFRYGPWDHRYRKWIALLKSKGLVHVWLKGQTVLLALTEKGQSVARDLGAQTDFTDLLARCELADTTAGNLNGTKLKDTIYEVVPEITGMAWGEEIAL